MSITRANVLAGARWQARQHAAAADALTGAQWGACLGRAWRRLWAVHPEAFHVDGELVGELPGLPTEAADIVPVVDEFADVLAAGAAADALGNMAVEDPERAQLVAGVVQTLEARFARGVG